MPVGLTVKGLEATPPRGRTHPLDESKNMGPAPFPLRKDGRYAVNGLLRKQMSAAIPSRR